MPAASSSDFTSHRGPFPIPYDDGMLGLVLAMHAGRERLPDHPRWIREHMGDRVVDFRARLLPQIRARTNLREMDILDFGCGTGSAMVVLGEAAVGSRVTGIDGDARALEIARRRLRHHGLADRAELFRIPPVARACDLAFADASFHFVLANGVLELAVSPAARRQAVLEVWRLLRPGGLLFVRRTSPGWCGLPPATVVRTLRGAGATFEIPPAAAPGPGRHCLRKPAAEPTA